MQVGDVVEIETLQGSFRYEMTEQLIVDPSDTYVLDDVGDNRLTLTACHPKLSSKQRIVIHAVLVGNPVERLPGQGEDAGPTDSEPVRRAAIDEFESEPIARFPGAWWGLVCIAALGDHPGSSRGRCAAARCSCGRSPTSSAPRSASSCCTCSSSPSATKP